MTDQLSVLFLLLQFWARRRRSWWKNQVDKNRRERGRSCAGEKRSKVRIWQQGRKKAKKWVIGVSQIRRLNTNMSHVSTVALPKEGSIFRGGMYTEASWKGTITTNTTWHTPTKRQIHLSNTQLQRIDAREKRREDRKNGSTYFLLISGFEYKTQKEK